MYIWYKELLMSKNYDVSQGQNVQNYRKVNGQAKKAAQSNTTKPNSIMTKQTNKQTNKLLRLWFNK